MTQSLTKALGNAFLAVLQSRTRRDGGRKKQYFIAGSFMFLVLLNWISQAIMAVFKTSYVLQTYVA